MSAYLIANYDISDPAGYEAYVPGVIPLLQKHSAEIVVADYETKALEGDKRSVFVVLKFSSEEAAMAWYNDPEYQPFKKIRIDCSENGSLILAKQFVPPGS